jgi:hypothetical protein
MVGDVGENARRTPTLECLEELSSLRGYGLTVDLTG